MTLYGPNCPICPTAPTQAVLRRSGAPVFVNRVHRDRAAALAAPRGDIDLLHCSQCGLLFNASYDSDKLRFDGGYENEQAVSPAYREHLAANVGRVLGLSPATLIEIGCGQGTFLLMIAEAAPAPLRLVGYDPVLERTLGTSPREERVGAATVRLVPALFGGEVVEQGAGHAVFLLRSVVEYLTDPVAFLARLRDAAGGDADLAIESASAGAIIANRAVHDLYYEYFAFYSPFALRRLFERAGWGEAGVAETFNGQYLWAQSAPLAGDAKVGPLPFADALTLADAARDVADEWDAIVRRSNRPVALWGASGKGINFASLVDPTGDTIDCIIDINPVKQGSFAPCTGHPIVSPEEARRRGVRAVRVLNPNYRSEVEAMLAAIDPSIELID